MLVGLCGGICAGKRSVAKYLVQKHNFRILQLATEACQPAHFDAVDQLHLQSGAMADTPAQVFQSADDLVLFITARWQEHWVITDLSNESLLEKLLLRPFFLLVSIDAPITLRWRRFTDRCWRKQLEPPELERFVLLNDQHQYQHKNGVVYVDAHAHIRLFNASSSIHDLHAALDALDILNHQRLRPSWDEYFMQLASLAAQRSNCMKRRVGCVLVKDRRVMSTGYNGTARNTRNCNQGGCPRCNLVQGTAQALSTCLCLHAEENALLEAGRERIGEGCILYCNTCPCLTCSVKIAQLGISEVVYSQAYDMDRETAAILEEAGVKLRQFSPPCNGLIDIRFMFKQSCIQESPE
ncbi:Deoxycytidine monophosphate (dCMP) deaminase [Coccidioides posadasii str. Silveira]|uniref:Deoxycytidylate deaminase n=2 Tax=Coccidioides posadasii TaxID=199306 RepID=E9D0G3_COCPS|nr:deoxycytidylate deaminase [Coccidioides posadasii str. Silveira]KMM73609.1 dCMP deaminase [Coccidioides posadasii RMSCC 3488]QVM09002.1 Deoxycytidine monophosphate (dCMP) deaminase [Coccidioides posadasii str. Silveira]